MDRRLQGLVVTPKMQQDTRTYLAWQAKKCRAELLCVALKVYERHARNWVFKWFIFMKNCYCSVVGGVWSTCSTPWLTHTVYETKGPLLTNG